MSLVAKTPKGEDGSVGSALRISSLSLKNPPSARTHWIMLVMRLSWAWTVTAAKIMDRMAKGNVVFDIIVMMYKTLLAVYYV